MILYPAIDIKDGNVVRLAQGKFDEITEYSGDPIAMAHIWEQKGAQWLHVVDLDGAKTGEMLNRDIILDMVKAVKIPIQIGGGIRKKEDIQTLLNGGIARLILGTRIIEDRAFLKEIVTEWGDKIAVSLDCADGMVAQRGWTATSNLKAVDFVKELEEYGVSCIIYTDIARDGMLTGPNYEGLTELAEATTIPLIASGGISDIEDIKKLIAIQDKGIVGAITGRAIYEGKLDIKEALALCSQSG